MDDFDRLMRRVGSAPVHPGLVSMEGEVFARAARQASAGRARRGMISAVVCALALGVVSGVSPDTATADAHAIESFAVPPPLAPSALLGAAL